jgi:hypothetical protein
VQRGGRRDPEEKEKGQQRWRSFLSFIMLDKGMEAEIPGGKKKGIEGSPSRH